MQITAVESYPVTPVPGGRGYFFLTVDTDEGISGVGEAGLSGRPLAIAGVVDHLRPLLLGADPFQTEHLWQVMFRSGFFPADRIATSAIAAIDLALWDIKGKALGRPVYQLLGGRVRGRVVCYPHNAGPTPEALAENVAEHVAAGWKFARFDLPDRDGVLEPTEAIRATVRRFAEIRKRVGEEVELCCDVHTRLDPADAVRLCQAVAEYRPFFIEDPIRSEGPESYRLLRLQTRVPLAAGEQFAHKWEFRRLIEEDLIDYARIDLCICGGLTEARKIAGWCETHYLRLATHNPLGPVSSAACLHLNLTTPNFGVQEQPRRPGTTLTDLFPVQIEWRDGYLLPPERPGLGVEFDRTVARRMAFEPGWNHPRLRRADGSFTNW